MKTSAILRIGQRSIPTAQATVAPAATSAGQCPFHPTMSGVEETKAKKVNVNVSEKPKPFADIPMPKTLPVVGKFFEFLRAGGGRNLHLFTTKRHAELGPLYREEHHMQNVLFVGDPATIKDVYKSEEATPIVYAGNSFEYMNQLHQLKRGAFFTNGEEWKQLRSPANSIVLRKRDLSKLHDGVLDVYNDHFRIWADIANKNGGRLAQADRLIHEAGTPAIAAFLMGNKLYKNHRKQIDQESKELFWSMKAVWTETDKMHLIQPKFAHKFRLSLWKRFEAGAFASLVPGNNWVKLVEADSETGPADGMIQMLLSEFKMDSSDVMRLMGDIVSTSDTEFRMISFLVYAFGRHPEAQQKVYDELNRICGPGKKLDHRDLDQVEYLRACIKEILRLYPVPAFTTRVLTRDAVVGGYQVPSGTFCALNLYASQRDPKFFPDPDRFWPERWFRVARSKQTVENSENDLWDTEAYSISKYQGVFGATPYMVFGWGTRRGCLFRKVSLVRMNLFMGRMIQEFKFTCGEVTPTMISVLTPDRDMDLRVEKRA